MKAKLNLHKLLSMLLALVMVVGMLPAMSQVAYAYSEGDIEGTTGSGASEHDPVVCDTFAEFKAAMENSEILYVKLSNATETIHGTGSYSAAIEQNTNKTLIIDGNNTFTGGLNEDIACLLYHNGGSLVVKGTGTLTYRHGNSGGIGAVIYQFNGGLDIQDEVKLHGSSNGDGFGKALCIVGGSTRIFGGQLTGYITTYRGRPYSAVEVNGSSASLTIYGGEFFARADNYSGATSPLEYGLYIMNGTVVLEGGTYYGIDADTAKRNLSALLGEDCVYTKSDGTVFDGTSIMGTNEMLTVKSTHASVNMTVSAPEVGKTPNDMTYSATGLISGAYWFYASANASGSMMNYSTAFAGENTYSAIYQFTIPDGSVAKFASDISTEDITVNTGTVYAVNRISDKEIQVTVNFPTLHKDIVDEVNMTVSAPEVGKTPNDMTYSATGLISGTNWFFASANGTGTLMSGDTAFVSGNTYSATYQFKIPDSSSDKFATTITTSDITVNNGTVYSVYRASDKEIQVTVNFPTLTDENIINTVSMMVSAPEVGKTPNDMTYSATGLISGANWFYASANASGTIMSGDTTFVSGNTYSAIYQFTIPDSSSDKFATTITTSDITVNNGTVYNVYRASDKEIQVTVNFGSTAATTEHTIAVEGGTASVGAGTPVDKATAGTVITLNVDESAIPAGMKFDKWEVVSGGVTVTGNTFEMPDNDVKIKATYKVSITNQEVPVGTGVVIPWPEGATKFQLYEGSTMVSEGEKSGYPTGMYIEEQSTAATKTYYFKVRFSDGWIDSNEFTVTWKDTSHTHNLTLVTENPATCTTPGNKAYYTCDGCDKWFEDAFGSVEITDKTSVIISATNHTPSDWKSDADNHWKECTVVGCGVIIKDSKDAHTASDWITDTAATATTDGTKHKECNVCYRVLETGTIPATGSGSSGIIIFTYSTLTFDTNGGSSISKITKIKGTTVDLEKYEPTKEGYEFTGWYSDKELTDEITSIKLTNNTTVYAGWEAIKENPSTGAFPFVDVDTDDWFFEDVAYVYDKGLMNGVGDNLFAPEISTDRAMIVTILWRMEGCPVVNYAMNFTDVQEDQWYTEAIRWAEATGIVNGYGNGLFGTTDPITLEQAAAILHRYAAYKGWTDDTTVPILPAYTYSEWAENDVIWAELSGIFSGVGTELDDLTAAASRAEIASFLHRFCEDIAK